MPDGRSRLNGRCAGRRAKMGRGLEEERLVYSSGAWTFEFGSSGR